MAVRGEVERIETVHVAGQLAQDYANVNVFMRVSASSISRERGGQDSLAATEAKPLRKDTGRQLERLAQRLPKA